MNITEEINTCLCGDLLSLVTMVHEIHKHWSPTNNDDSTVLAIPVFQLDVNIFHIMNEQYGPNYMLYTVV
jgi:hypothetical protein